jgi:hypothetical protein
MVNRFLYSAPISLFVQYSPAQFSVSLFRTAKVNIIPNANWLPEPPPTVEKSSLLILPAGPFSINEVNSCFFSTTTIPGSNLYQYKTISASLRTGVAKAAQRLNPPLAPPRRGMRYSNLKVDASLKRTIDFSRVLILLVSHINYFPYRLAA